MRLGGLSAMGSRDGSTIEVEDPMWQERNVMANNFASPLYAMESSIANGMTSDYLSVAGMSATNMALTQPSTQYTDSMSSLNAVTRNTPGYTAAAEFHEYEYYNKSSPRFSRKVGAVSYGGVAQQLATEKPTPYDANFLRPSPSALPDLPSSLVVSSPGYLPELSVPHSSDPKTHNSFPKYADDSRAGISEFKNTTGCVLDTSHYSPHVEESFSKIKQENPEYLLAPRAGDSASSKIQQMADFYAKSPPCYRSTSNLGLTCRAPIHQQPSPVGERAPHSSSDHSSHGSTDGHYPLENPLQSYSPGQCGSSGVALDSETTKNDFVEQKGAMSSDSAVVDLHRALPESAMVQGGNEGLEPVA